MLMKHLILKPFITVHVHEDIIAFCYTRLHKEDAEAVWRSEHQKCINNSTHQSEETGPDV